MKYLCLSISLSLLFCLPLTATELLSSDEQSFESGPTAGRWQKFTWPDTSSGGFRPSPLDKPAEDITGATVTVEQWPDAAALWGASCVAIYDDDSSEFTPDCGGIMITVDVIDNATYTISGHINFATDVSSYHAAGGISVDTDGGIDPSFVEYGYADGDEGTADARNEFDPPRAPDPTFGGDAWLTGEWAWNESFINSPGLEGQWWGPDETPADEFTVDVLATGSRMTIFLWGIDKFNDTAVLFDGISVDGPAPAPPAGAKDWDKYR